MNKETKAIFQPFIWVTDEETDKRLSNNHLSIYRDVVTGCRLLTDLLLDEKSREMSDMPTIFDKFDRSGLEYMLRSSLLMLEEHLTLQTEDISQPKFLKKEQV